MKKVILPFINETKDILKRPKGWTTDKVITSFTNDKVNDALFNNERHKLKDVYSNKLNQIFKKEYDWNFIKGWYNYYTEGEWQEKHCHTGISPLDAFSAIHFVSWKADVHMPVTFYDPLHMFKDMFTPNSADHSKWTPDIKEGDLLIFPSYLEHSVPKQPSTPDYPRITISFNLQFYDII